MSYYSPHQAANDIQRVFRGYRVRNVKVHLYEEKLLTRAEIDMKNDNATIIQTFFRKYIASKKLEEDSFYLEFEEDVWHEIQNNAATSQTSIKERGGERANSPSASDEEDLLSRGISNSSTNSLYDWEQSSAELWDRKLQLERELKAVEEQQTELLGNHVVRMNNLMFNREPM
eukprot:g9320.t1